MASDWLHRRLEGQYFLIEPAYQLFILDNPVKAQRRE
jgi:hypothetical protein